MSKDLTDALRKLTERSTPAVANQAPQRGAASRVISAAPPPGAGAGRGGMSDLTEQSVAAREYWPTAWRTTDGLFEFPAIKKVVMRDAENTEISLNFASPQ